METKKDDIKTAIDNMKDPVMRAVMTKFHETILVSGFSEPEIETPEDPTEQALRQLEGLGMPTKEAICVTCRPLDDVPCLLAAKEWKAQTLDNLEAAQLGRCELPFLNIVFFGPNGRGKSVAAAWLLSQVETKSFRKIDSFPMWTNADEYIRLTLSDVAEDKVRLRRMQTAKVLVIDELGGETVGSSRYAAEALSRLIVERDGKMRPTIVTSNLPTPNANAKSDKDRSVERTFLEEIKSRYDGRVVSRFVGDAMLVEGKGADLRAKRRAGHRSGGSNSAPASLPPPAYAST
jgi:DNA replication protein DnaC